MKKEECLHDNSSCCTDVDVEINKTWDKFVRQSKKAGFREGANDARESRFQEYFDIGYNFGLQSGVQEGKKNGILKAQELLQNVEDTEQSVTAPKKSACLLCENEELKSLPVAEIKEMMENRTQHNM